MKTKYLFTLALASSLAFAGCEDLDTMPSGGTVTSGQKEEVAESLPERAEAGVTAILRNSVYMLLTIRHLVMCCVIMTLDIPRL